MPCCRLQIRACRPFTSKAPKWPKPIKMWWRVFWVKKKRCVLPNTGGLVCAPVWQIIRGQDVDAFFFPGPEEKICGGRKERLRLIIAHERTDPARSDYLPALQRELLAVISKYVNVTNEEIKVHLERQENIEVLEVKIEIPQS